MKIIISHDVDHITAGEHFRDLMIPKFIIRGLIELSLNKIKVSELRIRFGSIIRNKLQNLAEIMNFDKSNSVSSTFFVSVAKGVGLNYSNINSSYWIQKIINNGFDVGIHGIVSNNIKIMYEEHHNFKMKSLLKNFGIRMHYLKLDNNTLNILNQIGYSYDSSYFAIKNPFKIGNLWEFPLHVMDTYIFHKNGSKWQNQTLIQSQEMTKRIIDKVLSKDIKYLTILMHDVYFSNGFQTWIDWYTWLILYLKENQFAFINYSNAIAELENESI